jgi:hypothetical protein
VHSLHAYKSFCYSELNHPFTTIFNQVARRIKVFQPTDDPFFEVSAPRMINGEPLKQSKIAAGESTEICHSFDEIF